MAIVTMELRMLLRTDFELFDFEYQISDPNWKETLERDITDYYYFHEIGQETADRFKHIFKAKMRRIMPYYDELYQTTLLDIDPLFSHKMTEDYKASTTGVTLSKSNSASATAGNEQIDTRATEHPQTGNVDTDIPSESSRNVGETSSSVTATDQASGGHRSENDYIKTIEGFSDSPHKLLKEYRANIVRINELIINELRSLFILVY